ncbi:MAG: hypothetical protein HDR72_05745, partial [Ruminococcaceae bacterium]|nr:hypothetical protein [Oscillospiraceae bacterium]
MKLKKILMCAALAAGMLLTGCNNGSESFTLKEIEGFSGNISDVSPKE